MDVYIISFTLLLSFMNCSAANHRNCFIKDLLCFTLNVSFLSSWLESYQSSALIKAGRIVARMFHCLVAKSNSVITASILVLREIFKLEAKRIKSVRWLCVSQLIHQ